MKDPADRYTLDLFDACRESLPRSGVEQRFRRSHNPGNKRLNMFITKRSFAHLDELARARGCTKRRLIEDLLNAAWETAEGAMTQPELWHYGSVQISVSSLKLKQMEKTHDTSTI